MDCIIHGVAKSRTQLSNFHFHFLWIQAHMWEHQILGLALQKKKFYSGRGGCPFQWLVLMSIPTYWVGGFSFLLACSCIIAVTCENGHSESWDMICHRHFDFQFCACWQCTATGVSCEIYRQHICCFFYSFSIEEIAQTQVKFSVMIIKFLWSICQRYRFSAHVEGTKQINSFFLFFFWLSFFGFEVSKSLFVL